MAAKLVFSTQNNYKQYQGSAAGSEQGICTVASLTWARTTLKKGGPVQKFDELPLDEHTMNAQMAVLRQFDRNPQHQTDLAQLEIVGNDTKIASVDDVVRLVKATAPHVAIFWTEFPKGGHTMGYRYSHNEKEFFDMEVGLFRATETDDIKKKMTEIISKYPGSLTGLRVVKLKS
jgi:hypothetical protein